MEDDEFTVYVVLNDSKRKALQAAARVLRDDDVPWYEVLTLRYDDARRESGVVTVVSVLAANAMAEAVDKTALAPVLEVGKGLIGIARAAASLRQDVLETIEYCVTISRCVIKVCKQRSLPQPIRELLGAVQVDMMEVTQLARRFSSPVWRRWQLLRLSQGQTIVDELKKRLKNKLILIMRGIVVVGVNSSCPPASQEVKVRGEVPRIPSTYVRRAMDDSVVEDVIDPGRPASSCHCVWGMGGAGKSLLAASVVRDERTLSSFKQGVFWITVGKAGMRDQVEVLLEHLSMLFERAQAKGLFRRPSHSENTAGLIQHLKRARGDGRCLVVLDDVWHREVVDSFAATGFHVLVTTRRREVVRGERCGHFTEVPSMTDGEALELLGTASQAAGPLSEHEARSVIETCGRLPLALNMVGRLGREDPLQPKCWRAVLDRLRDKHRMFRNEEVSDNGGVLFPVIDATFDLLPRRQKEQFRLMVAVASGVPVTTDVMANLWDMEREQVRSDVEVLTDYSLVHETDGVYRLHDLTHEYLWLHTKMTPDTVSLAVSRQARFLVAPETLLTSAPGERKPKHGGRYRLVKLWAAVKKLDQSRSMWNEIVNLEEASTDKAYMKEVSMLMRMVGKYEEAEPLYRRSMGITEAALGTEDLEYVVGLNDLATLLEQQGKYEEAERRHRRSLDTIEATLGKGNQEYSIILNNLATLLLQQGKYKEAEPLYHRSMDITEAARGTDHPQYAIKLNNLATLLSRQGKYEEAETLQRRSMTINEKTLGADHPEYSIDLNNLAEILEKQGKYEEAEPLYRRAVAITETTLGMEHPQYSIKLSGLAGLLLQQGKYAEAEPLYRRAIAITEATLGNDHPSYSTRLANLAVLLSRQGKHEEAEMLQRRAMTITEVRLGKDNPEYSFDLSNLARLLEYQDKTGEAETLYRDALDISERHLGPGHPDTLFISDRMAKLLETRKSACSS